jgi:hypothetical protein
MLATELASLFARDLHRLRQELEGFPDDAMVWATAPGVTNSAGTLALHLEGNLREYVGRQLGGKPYIRERQAEFSTRNVPRADLVERVAQLQTDIPPVIGALTAAVVEAVYPEAVLGMPMTTRQFLVHLHGHLNYHLGQIDYLRRITTGSGALPLVGLV